MTSHKQSQLTNEILNGNLVKLMFKLSTPGILGMLLIALNTFLDALFAGRLIGETALAAISLALPLTFIVIGCGMSVGVGSASILSRAIGSGDTKTQSRIFGTLIIISVIISSFITIFGYSFSDELISFMGGEGEVAAYGSEYFKTYLLGSVFLVVAVSSSQLIKAEGRIALASLFAGIYVVLNNILNPLFVSVFNLGIKGIAWATVISGVVYCFVNCTYFISGKSLISVNPKQITLAVDLLPTILSVGTSVMLMQVIGIVQQIVFFKSIAYYGTDSDIAFAGATISLYSLVITPLYGFVQALNPVIGMNYGARDYKRIKDAYLIFGIGGTIFLILIWLPLQLDPKIFLSWLIPNFAFTYNDLLNFRLVVFFLPFASFISCSIALFQSIGNGKMAGFITLLRQLVLFLPIFLILPIFFGVNGIYYGFPFVDTLAFVIISLLTWIEFKKNHSSKPC
ncbi:MATE family efflux transporter [Allocoleopsis franciscana]|uniref:Multidrug export protein MepA n=1 Tax=Allocoleopsis franciscana PCC 7113 TaxID=1173027 RepID=K9WCT6_9CYAN|nr:MATE family efflux transporter [Allocoleopsis franciscana]AFZ17601.1 Na+-driven multidrug efflux pump [Allocoleopsis franciscana PCC 7113]